MTEFTITPNPEPDPSKLYPKNGSHEWGAFAGVAIELGGYGDLEAVNPYTGDRFWAPVFQDGSIYDAMRRLVDLMERERFLGGADNLPAHLGSKDTKTHVGPTSTEDSLRELSKRSDLVGVAARTELRRRETQN